MKRMARISLKLLGVIAAIGIVGFLLCFPGRQTSIAFTLATGLGISGLQARVDELEEKAIGLEPLS